MNQFRNALYVHYQFFERDGSHVHTTNFAKEFSQLGEEQQFGFDVVSPELFSGVPGQRESWLGRLRSRLAPYYLSDIKTLLQQCLNFFKERRMLRERQVDIVLTRYNGDTISIIWACRSLNIPVILEINAPEGEQRETHYYHVPAIQRLFSTRRVLKLCNGGFAVSGVLAREFEQAIDGRIPVRAIHNGVDLEQFDPALYSVEEARRRFAVPEDAIVIGFVGSFAPWHGVGLLLEAFAELVKKGYPVHLLLVGQVRADAEQAIARAKQSDICDAVTFTGFVPAAEVAQCLAAMDISVLANTEYYCSPLKIFEYMAMQTAVVAVETDPVREVIVDQMHGLLFQKDSAAELQQQLLRLLESAELREQLGKAARDRVLTEFSWRKNAEHVNELLNDVWQRQQRETTTG